MFLRPNRKTCDGVTYEYWPLAESWYGQTALEDILGVGPDKVNDDRLYRALDALLAHKDALCRHFQKVCGELFGTTFDILLYDITSTYFEGQAAGNPQARRGHSRDKRPDCVQVCIALVVTPEGLPLAYEVFDGNRRDVTTVEEMVETMRTKHGHERRTWVMDGGMVSEANLDLLRKVQAHYLVGTPKSMLKQFEHDLLEQDWEQVDPEVEVKLRPSPEGEDETFVLCRSRGRIEKERAIRERQHVKLEAALNRLKARIDADTRALRKRSSAERRVGRYFQKYSRAAHLFRVTIREQDDPTHKSGKRLAMTITPNPVHRDWAELCDGCYLLRTNLKSREEPRPQATPEDLHRPHADRRRLPHQQTRFGPPAHLPPERGPDPSPHPRVFSGARAVAHPPAVDGRSRSRNRAPQASRRHGRSPFLGRGLAYPPRRGIAPAHRQQTRAAARHPAPETRLALAQQTKVDPKCSGENPPKIPDFPKKYQFPWP